MARIILILNLLADSQLGFEGESLETSDSSGVNMGVWDMSRRMGLKVFQLVVAACGGMFGSRDLRHLNLKNEMMQAKIFKDAADARRKE
jgi:hypothetical protein